MNTDASSVIYIVILIIAPFLGTLITNMFNLLIDKELPPLLPQINGYSFGQTVVALAAIFLVSQQSSQRPIPPLAGILAMLIFVALIFLLVVAAWVDKKQEEITQKHLEHILSSVDKIKLKNGRQLYDLMVELSRYVIGVDFIPGSPVEKLTHSRAARRRQLVELLNNYLAETSKLTEEDLRIPEDARKTWRNTQLLVTILSLAFYFGSIIAFVNITR